MTAATGPTILLASGSYFDLLDAAGSHFTIRDIAHGLSNACRFAGQCRDFYSVAEHSWHASFLVPPAEALAALLHDAAEAFLGDVTRPLKSLLPEYRAIEAEVEAAIAARFALGDTAAPAIKRADLWLLLLEQQAMMPLHPDEWPIFDGIEPLARVDFRFWPPREAKRHFLARWRELSA